MPDTIEHGAQKWSNKPQKLLKTSTIYKNFHLGGEEEESLEEMDGFVKNNPQKKKKFFSKHPVAKKAKVFHEIC